MKRLTTYLMTATLSGLAFFAQALDADSEAPDFTLKSNQGVNMRLHEHRGEVVMINFWASWCGPCRQEMPHLEQIHNDYSPMGFTLLGVNVDEDQRDADKALRRFGVSFPVLYDSDNQVAELFKVETMPTTIILDRDGNVRHLHHGYKPGYEDDYADQVRQLIRE